MTGDANQNDPQQRISDLLVWARMLATGRDTDRQTRWVNASHAPAGRLRTHMLAADIQAVGVWDQILRALEEELAGGLSGLPEGGLIFAHDTLASLSRLWVLSAYECVRVLKRGFKGSPEAKRVHDRFLTVRIPLAKYEIAQDDKLRDGVLYLGRHGDGPDAAPVEYRRTAKVPVWPNMVFNPESRSIGWTVIDLDEQADVTILRRDLSDDLLALLETLALPSPASPEEGVTLPT